VELALWFHDVINDPGSADNEARSARLFREWAAGVMDEGCTAAVADLILVTTHLAPVTGHDQQFICDIDLTSFGCPWEHYKRDTDNLKAEFRGSADDYYTRKSAFLQAMLDKPRIFQTDFFHDRYERLARENILRLLGLFAQRLD
jgi:predicted metal-dependent HD superfamily phosphohydrolase